jgi:hypothetical protein
MSTRLLIDVPPPSGQDDFTRTRSLPCEPGWYCLNATRFDCEPETESLEYGLTRCPYLSCAGSGYWNGTFSAAVSNPSRCLQCGERYQSSSGVIEPDPLPASWYCTRQEVTRLVTATDIFGVSYAQNISYNVTTRTFVELGLVSTGCVSTWPVCRFQACVCVGVYHIQVARGHLRAANNVLSICLLVCLLACLLVRVRNDVSTRTDTRPCDIGSYCRLGIMASFE